MMISRRHFVAICFGLMAGFWCTPGVFAQERPTVAEASRATRWDTIQWVERRYKIEAIRFKARDETGIDWPGSDEVMVETRDVKGWTVTREIDDIDSGDTHNFDPAKSCIVAVRPGVVVLGESSVCEDAGEPAPLSFQVQFWEKGWFSFPSGFCLLYPLGTGAHAGPHCPNDGNGDEFIGRSQIDYSTQELEAALPHVGDELIETVRLDACPDLAACGNYPDYTFTWRVTRLADVRVDFREVLDEAMQRSGAGSELEAIAAGLRSLRAPSPRKIEPKTVDPSPER